VYWLNGSRVTLASNGWAEASSIFVSASNVYVAGMYRGTGVGNATSYWKNGIGILLDQQILIYTKDVKVSSNEDVHMAGYQQVAGVWDIIYWKNDIEKIRYHTNMTHGGSVMIGQSYNIELAVANDDVYIIESSGSNGFGASKYVKNGKIENFTNESGATGRTIVAAPKQ
jgi:hypothetical protein